MKRNRARGRSGGDTSGPIRITVFAAVILLAISLIVGYIWRALGRSEYFCIRHIVIKQSIPVNLKYLEGKNIFSINLAQQSRYLAQFYPDYKLIKLTRVLPDRLYVDIRKRTPVAAVKLYKNFAVDEDGLLFDLESTADQGPLPIVTGLETKIFGPKAGKKYPVKELRMALQVIAEAKKSRTLKDYAIYRIDASSPANLSLLIVLPAQADGKQAGPKQKYLEVKLGGGTISPKVRLLDNILAQEKDEICNIKYIDVRFANPVIKFNDAKR